MEQRKSEFSETDVRVLALLEDAMKAGRAVLVFAEDAEGKTDIYVDNTNVVGLTAFIVGIFDKFPDVKKVIGGFVFKIKD